MRGVDGAGFERNMRKSALDSAQQHPMWHDAVHRVAYLRGEPLPASCDVVILGGGYTGLWTALWLKGLDSTLSVAVIEAEHVGYGASSRNGGWVSALLPTSGERLAEIAGGGESGESKAKEAFAFLRESVADFGDTLRHFGIDADFQHSGAFLAARTPLHEQRARADVHYARRWGASEADLRWMPAAAAKEFASMDGQLGGTFTPHCASIQPATLVAGLAQAAAERGVRIHEGVRARSTRDGLVVTDSGDIRAQVVVRALEGYTPSLAGERRTFAPVYSLMLATEPLDEETLGYVGLKPGITFADYRHLIIYGQRTADNRIAFGGRGAPYHFGSRVRDRYEHPRGVHAALHSILLELFPALGSARITHTWGGALAVPRDWTPSMGYSPERKFAYSGGYLGDGVTMSYIGGRTVAELICGRQSRRTRQPWVNRHSRRWEPEPLRWLGIQSGLSAMTWADAQEARTGRESQVAAIVDRLVGRH